MKTQNSIEEFVNRLHTIKSPELTKVEYGQGINDMIENINENFRKVSEYDFIKGEQGDSVYIVGLNIDESNALKQALKNEISSIARVKSKSLEPIRLNDNSQINWSDNLTGTIFVLYKGNKYTTKPEPENIIGSLPYTFTDARFYVDMNSLDMDHNPVKGEYDWTNQIDTSCIISYDINKKDEDGNPAPGFKRVDAFPTLYFEKKLHSFCWKLNGVNTGIVASGPNGVDGEAGYLLLIRRGEPQEEGYYTVDKIYESSSWKTLEQITDLNGLRDKTAIVLQNEKEPPKQVAWASPITFRHGAGEDSKPILYVRCTDTNAIGPQLDSDNLKKILLEVGLPESKLQGLFLPIHKKNKTSYVTMYSKPNSNLVVLDSTIDLNRQDDPDKHDGDIELHINMPVVLDNIRVKDTVQCSNMVSKEAQIGDEENLDNNYSRLICDEHGVGVVINGYIYRPIATGQTLIWKKDTTIQ